MISLLPIEVTFDLTNIRRPMFARTHVIVRGVRNGSEVTRRARRHGGPRSSEGKEPQMNAGRRGETTAAPEPEAGGRVMREIQTTVVGSYPIPDWLPALPSQQALRDATAVAFH